MTLSNRERELLKRELVACLKREREITRIVVFGSFVNSPSPNDIDVAVFQDSSEGYLTLALKYRRDTSPLARKIPLDIIPLRDGVKDDAFLAEIERGEVVYERPNP